MAATSSVIPTAIDLKEHEHDHNPKEWHRRGCSTLDKRTGGTQKSRLGSLHATLTNADRLWDNGKTITCAFVRPAGTKIQQEKVKAVVKEWEQYANLKFQFVTGRNATVRISFNDDPDDDEGGSWSYIAKDVEGIPSNEATMNYGWVSKSREITEEDKGVILHEFGHTIGLLHEHQSSRRGEKITLDPQAVIEFYMETQGWTKEEVQRQILDVYNDNEVSSFSSVDLTSIMMYFMPAEMNLEHIEIPPNNALSELDKAYVFLNYPSFTTPPPNKQWTIEHALDVAGVKDKSREKILSEFKEKDWKGVRTEFALWSLNQKAAAIARRIGVKRAAAAAAATATAAATPTVVPATVDAPAVAASAA